MGGKRRFSQKRDILRYRRQIKNRILEMNAESLSARAAEADYAAWTKTDDYRKEADRLREIIHRIRKDFGEDIEFTEPE